MLGTGDIGAPADCEHLDVACHTSFRVNVAEPDAVFLHGLEAWRSRDLLVSKRKRFQHYRACVGDRLTQLLLRINQANLGRKKSRSAVAHALAIAGKIRLVMREEIGKGGKPRGACIRIK